jgi:hypothetical protein
LAHPALQGGQPEALLADEVTLGEAGLVKALRPLRPLGSGATWTPRRNKRILHAGHYARPTSARQMHPAGCLPYIPRTDTFIEKDSSINKAIERMRLSTMSALFARRDVIVVASVSCIYGIGSNKDYQAMPFPRPSDGRGCPEGG